MSPKWLLRGATLILVLFFLGHTVGGMLLAKSRGMEETVLLGALGAYRFEVMGFERSHLEFYIGEGWYLSLALAVLVALTWQLSNLSTEHPAVVRRLLVPLMVFCAGSIVLCILFFFAAPLVCSTLATVALGAAWWQLGRAQGLTASQGA